MKNIKWGKIKWLSFTTKKRKKLRVQDYFKILQYRNEKSLIKKPYKEIVLSVKGEWKFAVLFEFKYLYVNKYKYFYSKRSEWSHLEQSLSWEGRNLMYMLIPSVLIEVNPGDPSKYRNVFEDRIVWYIRKNKFKKIVLPNFWYTLLIH